MKYMVRIQCSINSLPATRHDERLAINHRLIVMNNRNVYIGLDPLSNPNYSNLTLSGTIYS